MESKKVLKAGIVHSNGFIPIKPLFPILRKILSFLRWIPLEATHSSVASYRVISPQSFFTEDFLDVSFKQQPEVNQVFRIEGIEGKWLLIRKNKLSELHEEAVQKEKKLNKEEIYNIDQIVEERYPHLCVKSGESRTEIEVLEILELD